MTSEQIENAVNEIIQGMNKEDYEHESINWGDLKVNDICSIHVVTIDEADPCSRDFCSAIENQFLCKYGFAIQVNTEW